MPSTLAAIVITLNEGLRLRTTVEQLQATLPGDAEIIVVDDGSTDSSTDFLKSANGRVRLLRTDHLGTARTRNLAVEHTEAETLLFIDAHMEFPAGWWEPMLHLLNTPRVGAVAPVVSDLEERNCKAFGSGFKGPDLSIEWLRQSGDAPYPVPLLPWCCAAIRRDTFRKAGGFDQDMVGWGGIDVEMSLRLWLLGYELWLAPQVEVFHLFRSERPFPVEWSWVIHNRLRTAFLHLSAERIAHTVESLAAHEGFAPALALCIERDIAGRRRDLRSQRVYEDNWYFEKFPFAGVLE